MPVKSGPQSFHIWPGETFSLNPYESHAQQPAPPQNHAIVAAEPEPLEFCLITMGSCLDNWYGGTDSTVEQQQQQQQP
jgi:hypothetical protein